MTIDIQRMKERLEAKRTELQRQIASLTEAHPTPVGPVEASEGPQDFEETAVDFLETQQEQSIDVNEQALLTEVNAALKRIEDGTYGLCVVCGQPIPEKRLEAIPWAARCVKDQEQLEQRNLSQEELYGSNTI
ncbi:MAG: TraR/DksA C4-type zinc finger protein [Ktedonobacteraceae bacterium]|nr:TraR/DksA C4-type zinc finger protein [Ktedonobacteraceae bacterium]